VRVFKRVREELWIYQERKKRGDENGFFGKCGWVVGFFFVCIKVSRGFFLFFFWLGWGGDGLGLGGLMDGLRVGWKGEGEGCEGRIA